MRLLFARCTSHGLEIFKLKCIHNYRNIITPIISRLKGKTSLSWPRQVSNRFFGEEEKLRAATKLGSLKCPGLDGKIADSLKKD